ncbi:MAG: hypothetical protein DHS20C18_02040 [Saprospiraceae bacterium]|nr:MAG: hypothetical protein DHS20C18_02040 [Saprospiraceae bacterium]
MSRIIVIGVLLLSALQLTAQEEYTFVNGEKMPYTIDDCGDTLILASLEGVSVSSLRTFEDDEEYRRYRRYRRYAAKVYPYAVEAIRIFREVDYATNHMKKRARKKYIKKLQKDLKDQFSDPLKKLTKTQGTILIKMIEKELDTPMYFLIKDLRNGFTASYWGTIGKLFGHNLREGYTPGTDLILDAVLNDMDISYDLRPPTDRPIDTSDDEEEDEEIDDDGN